MKRPIYEYKQPEAATYQKQQSLNKPQNDYLDSFLYGNEKRTQRPSIVSTQKENLDYRSFGQNASPSPQAQVGYNKENNSTSRQMYDVQDKGLNSRSEKNFIPVNYSSENRSNQEIRRDAPSTYDTRQNQYNKGGLQAPDQQNYSVPNSKYKNESQFTIQGTLGDYPDENTRQKRRGLPQGKLGNPKLEEASDNSLSVKQHRFPFDDYNNAKRKFMSISRNLAHDQDVIIKKTAIMLEISSRRINDTQEDQRYKEAIIRRMVASTRQVNAIF